VSDPILQIEGLSCGYGRGDVLRGVNLSLSAGEMAGLIGPNGAGKTTLFRAITGSLAPREGRVLLGGSPLAALPPRDAARRLAFAPQFLEVPFSFTVGEFVGLGRLPHIGRFASPGARDREAVRRALSLMGVEELAPRPLDTLSGGERQRAVIAQALAQEPEVLLLDEPAAHLDVGHQVGVFELLSRISGEGVAVLAALHDLNLAAEFFGRIVLVAGGKVCADGRPEDVITGPLLDAAFGIRLEVTKEPSSGKPFVRYRRALP
jgi:iron complex transport system ATP-binding protein